MSKLALYFGYRAGGGHVLQDERGTVWNAHISYPGFPWEDNFLDGGIIRNRKVLDRPDGRVHWVCGGRPDFWFAFVWWDRSGDKRGNSTSGFYVRWPMPEVTHEAVNAVVDEVFAFACSQWPDVVARQIHPLRLEHLPEQARREPTKETP